MNWVPSPQQWPLGPRNGLHDAARQGSSDRTEALLSSGSIDINQQDQKGRTPLICAAENGHSSVTRILLNKGSDVSITAHEGFTALHISSQSGHLAVTEMLVKAGAEVQARTVNGFRPLYLAAFYGHSEVMRALLDAGANPDSRLPNGESPLYTAASRGKLGAVRELFRAKANPLLTRTGQMTCVPLDGAAGGGHSEVVRELIQELVSRVAAVKMLVRMRSVALGRNSTLTS